MSDEQLVAQTIRGDTKAFAALVERYEKPLVRYAIFLIHDQDLAEDVAQETFIKVFRNLNRFNTQRKFSSWLYRIAHNTAMDAVKSNRTVALEHNPEYDRLTAVEPSVAERIDGEIRARDVGRCMAELSPKYRSPVFLYYFQNRPYAEISDILRIPIATVGVRINRAKAQLRVICKRLEVHHE